MANRDILAIGTSAGGVEALRFLASRFPRDFPASVLVVIHLSSRFSSTLDTILTEAGPLKASFAEDGEAPEPGRIYIGPPKSHLLLDENRLVLGQGPPENNARPAIDPLFRSVALCCGSRAMGMVLTGMLRDGAAGLLTLSQCGGITIVQEPSDAAFSGMPTTALSRLKPDHVVSLASMPKLLGQMVQQPAGIPVPCPAEIEYEVDIARGGLGTMSAMDRIGRRSVLSCPDCHGAMWEIDEGDLVRYRCHVGHAYTAELMDLAFDEDLQRSLTTALRVLDERVGLAQKLHKEASDKARTHHAASWAQIASDVEREAELLRQSIRRFDQMAARYVRDTRRIE